MLSILIPTYNYNVYPLVLELYNQSSKLQIDFEIIVIDDGSKSELNIENENINSLPNSFFKILENNIGRSAIRNLLAKESKYENLLFLDADTIPINKDFVENYTSHINIDEKVIYGGIIYQNDKPEKKKLLRWVYGIKREALSLKKRKKNPYICFLTLNFLIKKSIFKKVKFNESIENLRHEDTLFSYDLGKNKIKIVHIKNPVCHLGLETSLIFIKKSEEALIGLNNLINSQYINYKYTKISSYYVKIKTCRLKKIVAFTFRVTKPILLKQLLSNNPSLVIFDLYRLGYLCTIKQKD